MDNFTDSLIQAQPLSKKILRNTVYNLAGAGCSMLVSLILTPYILNYIGIEKFGIWVIANVLVAYFGFFDFSVATPLIKYASEFYVKKDFSRLNQLFNTSFLFYLTLVIIMSFIGLILSSLMPNLFTIPAGLYKESLFVIRMCILAFACMTIFGIFANILIGLQRMDIENKILITSSIINIIGTVFVLKSGYGLPGLIINYLVVILIRGILAAIMVFKIVPEFKFNIFGFEKTIFKMLFGFGAQFHLAKFAFLVTFQIDKILLARLLNISSVAFYELGSKITFTIRRLSFLLILAMVPAASELDATRGRAALYNFYLRGSKYLTLISAPAFLFVIFNARLILAAWLGSGYIESIAVIQILALGYLANVLTGIASATTVGMGKPEFEMKCGLVVAPLNIVLSILLILKIGLVGACAGTTISLIIGAIFLLKMFHSYLERPLTDVIKFLWKIILASVLANILVLPGLFSATLDIDVRSRSGYSHFVNQTDCLLRNLYIHYYSN